MNRIDIEYPRTPPVWLAHWLDPKEWRALFSEGIRSYASRCLERDRMQSLQWTQDRFVFHLGDQQATWRWTGEAWQRSCSCGYRNDRCAHVYAAARVLHEILRQEQWLPAALQACPERGTTAVRRRPGTASRPSGPAPAAPRDSDSALRLEVEADFHDAGDQVAVRFYAREHGRRRLLRLQEVFNLAARARRSSAGADTAFPHEDRRFLRWLSGRLKSGDLSVSRNLQVLKLPRSGFDYWLEYWADCPQRFIERASQEFLSGSPHAARLFVELHPDGDWVQIVAVISSASGVRHPVHQIFKLLASGRRGLVLDGQLLDFKSPLSWDLLREVFARRTPRMRREHVCEHLPHLLEGRLDLLRGPLVRTETCPGKARLEARADGADILLRAAIEGAPILPDSGAAAAGLRSQGDQFVVTNYECPSRIPLRTFLRNLAPEPEGDGWLRVRGVPERVAALAARWQTLPADVAKTVDPALHDLLEAPAELRPELSVRMRQNYVDLHLGWACQDVRFTDAELGDTLAQDQALLRTQAGTWLRIDPERARQIRAELAAAGFGTADSRRLFRPEAGRLVAALQAQPELTVVAECQLLVERLTREPIAQPLAVPAHLDAVLRKYQVRGFEFLADRCMHGIGPLLADDMGLGKTLQVLTLLSAFLDRVRAGAGVPGIEGSGTLIICPASVVSVWLDEAARFCPELRCAAYTGSAEHRAAVLEQDDWDLLITNYALTRMDVDILRARHFAFLILDEAQQIKNPDAQITGAVKQLQASRVLALTGTPLENRLLDLWSIMDVLNPGFLGSVKSFQHRYEQTGDTNRLVRRLTPVILRRTKEVVAPELPPRTEEVLKVALAPAQRRLYERELVLARTTLAEKGPVELLAALMRLRQLCCHPALVAGKSAGDSAKLDTLMELLEEVLAEGHSALVFSQFTRMLALIEEALAQYSPLKITGATPAARRAQLVRDFNRATTPQVFLLSLKAAGTGLTLTKADYVFIFDPWWNPAAERQAIDRTHRIGQQKPVMAYRLVAADTVEEKVLALQAQKAELFADVVDAAAGAVPGRLKAADLQALLE